MPKDMRVHSVTQGHPRAICLGNTFNCHCSGAKKKEMGTKGTRKARAEGNAAQHQDQHLAMNREARGIVTNCALVCISVPTARSLLSLSCVYADCSCSERALEFHKHSPSFCGSCN